jgi:hypothetical protein
MLFILKQLYHRDQNSVLPVRATQIQQKHVDY